MDRDFMSHFFDINYEDCTGEFTKDCQDYKDHIKASHETEKELCELCGGITSQLWQLHEKCMNEIMFAELPLIREAYLQGAEDRERMLR